MNKIMILLLIPVFLLALSACGRTAEQGFQVAVAKEDQKTETDKIRLTADFEDALSVQAQLALGTVQLEETELAVDEPLATEILPLWQAVQSLSNSDTAAELEINAVINQIQDTMKVEQIEAITDMKLTEESMTAMLESGDLGFGRGNFGDAGGEGDGGGFQGGGPGGGFFGGGPGGGPGGRPGGGFRNLSEDDIATRRAQFAEGGVGGFQDRILIGAVTRLLQAKTGEVPERGRIFSTIIAIISEETGLSEDEIRAQTAGGKTLAELIEDQGGDIELVKNQLIEALNELPNAADIDAEQFAADWLGLGQ